MDQAARQLSLHKRTHVGEGEVLTVEWAPDLQSIAVLCECGSPEKRESKIYVIALGSSTMHSLEVQLRGAEMAALAWTADSRRILCCGPDQKLVRSCAVHVNDSVMHMSMTVSCAKRGVLASLRQA